jgi:large subunit ribosomal protein L19
MSNSWVFKNNTIGIGDKVKIIHKVIEQGKERRQVFLGTIIKLGGNSENRSVTVRRIGANQIGIERIFPINDPFLEEITVTKSGYKGVRSSKLYYIRNKSKKEIDKIYSRSSKKS